MTNRTMQLVEKYDNAMETAAPYIVILFFLAVSSVSIFCIAALWIVK